MSYFLLAAIVLVLLFFFFGPGYLTCSDSTRKADAVVLYVGPGYKARLDEARHLIREGYAGYLIVPFFGSVERINSNGRMEMISNEKLQDVRKPLVCNSVSTNKYYEDTYIETLEAKLLIDSLGLKSVILVSSTSHMRRIRIMADSVFSDRRRFVTCNPSRWQKPYTCRAWFDREKRTNIISEYIKILRFQVYSIVSQLSVRRTVA